MKIANLRWFLPGGVLVFSVNFFGSISVAGEQDSSPFVLPQVTVVGTVEDPISGKNSLSESQINSLPQGNGSINELLTTMPSVQASDMENTSLQGGEIKPPNVSISGGRYYENNFMIDGIGNNSLLDPTFSSSMSLYDVPSHPQEIFLNSRLLDNISIYRYNIPAKYGDFTGGVVDAQTKTPAKVFSGDIFYRTTREQWTEFHIDDEEETAFENSHDASYQPHFNKHLAGFKASIPATSDIRFLAAYNQSYSKLLLEHLGSKKTQKRRNENFFLKGVWDISSEDSFNVTVIHAPYEESLFKSNTSNSDYTLLGGGTSIFSIYDHFFSLGKLRFDVGYKTSENSREAPASHYSWNNSGVNDWGLAAGTGTKSFEGGYGSIEKTQDSVEVSLDAELDPIKSGMMTNAINMGLEYGWFQGSYDRKETTYIFSMSKLSSDVDCSNDPLGCIDSEFFYRRTAYDAHESTARMATYSAYLEDTMTLEDITLRPGLRFSYDDFMNNVNWAPRLAATWDIFGNGNTLLVGGRNRYYGKTLLTYKLREAWPTGRTESRSSTLLANNQPAPWPEPQEGIYLSSYQYSELATPYTEETVIGIDQALLGGRLNLVYVRREGKDEFAREYGDPDADGNKPWELNNNGRSHHEEYSLDWNRSWNRHALSLNVTYQDTTTSNVDYNSILEEETLEQNIWYEGSVYKYDELPRQDFNRTWVANLVYSVKFPYGLTFTNVTKYRSGFVGLEIIKKADWAAKGIPDGVDSAYYQKKQPESWIFNWRLDWRRNLYRNQGIQLSLEVYNVFNQKVPAGEYETIQTYELGRQFWVGMEYYF